MWTYTCIIEFFAVIGDSTCMKNYTRVIYECKETNEKLEARESVYVCVCACVRVWVYRWVCICDKKGTKGNESEGENERKREKRAWMGK